MDNGSKTSQGSPQVRAAMDLSVDLRSTWFTLRSSWKLLLCFALAAMSFAGLHTFFFQRPVYRASAVIKMDTATKLGGVNPLLDTFGGGAGEAMTVKLQTQLDFFHSPDYAEAVTTKLAERPELLKAMLEVNNGIKLQAHEVEVFREGHFISPERKFELGSAILKNLNMIIDPTGNSLLLYGESSEPKLAFELSEAASQVLLETNYRKVLSKITKTHEFLNAQVTELRQQLKSLESQLVEFQDKRRIFSPTDAQSAIYDAFVRNQEKLKETQRQLRTNDELEAKLKQDLRNLRERMTDPSIDMSGFYLEQLRHRKDVLQYQRALLQSNEGVKGGHLELKDVEGELEHVAKAYRNALEHKDREHQSSQSSFEAYQALEKNLGDLRQTKDRLSSELRALTRDLASQETRVSDLPTDLQNLAVLRRNIDMTTQLYLTSKKKLQEIEFAEAETTNDLYLLVRPRVPRTPSGMPIARMFVYAFFVGLFIGALGVVLKDILIHTVSGRKDFSELDVRFLTGIVRVGEFEDQNEFEPKRRGWLDIIRDEFATMMKSAPPLLVLDKLPESNCADNFRALRLKLLSELKYGHDHGQVVMVAGPVKGCGNSFVAANLASAMAKAEMNTLLIDLNLRSPGLNRFFPGLAQKGGVERLEGSFHDIDSLIAKAGVNLSVLLAKTGAMHPPDLLDSKEFHSMMANLRQKFDLIIVDTPPVLSSIDASLIASVSDAVLLVAGYKTTFTDDVKIAADSLRRSGEKEIFGVINYMDLDFHHRSA